MRALLLALTLAPLSTGCTSLKVVALDGFDRDAWQEPDRVVEALVLEPGDRVCDLGAGSGYFTWHLAEAVGPDGIVYAADVDWYLVDCIRDEAADRGLGQVVGVHCTADDPALPESGVDLFFLSRSFDHLRHRPDWFRRAARRYLREGGRVAILEDHPGGWLRRELGYGSTEEEIVSEMEAAGFALEARHELVPEQHFLIFAPSAP